MKTYTQTPLKANTELAYLTIDTKNVNKSRKLSNHNSMQKCLLTALNKNLKTKIQQIHRLFKYKHT